MFSRISAIVTVVIAAASCARMERHTRRTDSYTGGQCNTGKLSCCDSVTSAMNIASVLDFLSYSYDPADSVGINCTPINIIGAGEGAACQQQPVCCTNNTESGFVNFGCSPMNLN